MVNVIMVMIFDEDDDESGFDKDDGNQTLYLVYQSVKSIALVHIRERVILQTT